MPTIVDRVRSSSLGCGPDGGWHDGLLMDLRARELRTP
jgi:hypothetical protein